MIGLRFKAGDVVSDEHGTIGEIVSVHNEGLPYRIREEGGSVAAYTEYPTMRIKAPASMIRIYQCKDDCCLVQVPSRRFWLAEFNGALVATERSRLEALKSAADHVMALPLEVTA